MGGFYDSIHARTESYQLIMDLLNKLAKSKGHKFYIAPVINGWISMFPKNYGHESLACEISRHIEADVLQMMVHDDDVFRYLYYRKSKLIDEYNSCPDYFGGKISAKEKKRLKGNPEVFRGLVGSEDKLKKLRKLLKPKSKFGGLKISKESKQKIKEMEKEMKASSEALNNMINDNTAVLRFLENNPELFNNEMSLILKEAAARNLKSEEEIRRFLLEDKEAQQINMKLIKEYIKSLMSSKEFIFFRSAPDRWNKPLADIRKEISDQISVNDKRNIEAPDGIFASETMLKFAELLGISNALSSYEYLKAGETDGVKKWEQFIEIA